MQRSEAKALYNTNWDKEFTTLEDLYTRIRQLAELGCYEACVYIDSVKTYDTVKGALAEAGYDVEDYNGGGNGILEIHWG